MDNLKGNNQNLFKVPDGYFEDLPIRVQKRIELKQRHKRPAFFPMLSPAWKVLAAASVALIIVWFMGDFSQPKTDEQHDLLIGVTTSDIIDYLYTTGIDDEDIELLLANNDLNSELVDSESIWQDILESDEDDFIIDEKDAIRWLGNEL
ncbi:MAG: hypothetical protein ACFCUU_03255 [Cyclobacteriaceae bacterium]